MKAIMSQEHMDSGLTPLYDKLYREDDVSGNTHVSLAHGWPTDPREAAVYLARPGGRLLEIGCGRGELLATLAPCFGEIVGVELSSRLSEQAQFRLAHIPHCTILNEPLENLEAFINLPFDCIIWADVIEHVVDVIGAMRILARLARPGTQLVTVTPNVAFLPNRIRLVLGRAPTTATRYPNAGFADEPHQTVLHDAGHLHYFTFRQVKILYQLAGFRLEQRLGIARRFSRSRNLWPSLLSSSVCVSGTFQGYGARSEI
jgi:2-polyprenyl-3-methyl-5-hydroxy-6-metoxy-1,4-benzoquinol methylase